MTSIIPELYDYRVYLSVALVVLLMLGNLRGIRESGAIFMAPTYLYIVVMLGVIGWGLVQSLDRRRWRHSSRRPAGSRTGRPAARRWGSS